MLGGLAEAVAGVGELVVGAPVWLPPRRPRALAIEIGDPDGALRALRARWLARSPRRSIGFPSASTSARTSPSRGSAPAARRRAQLAVTPQLRFACERVALLRSQLEPTGARYEELASTPA